jgi:hypothetical protein
LGAPSALRLELGVLKLGPVIALALFLTAPLTELSATGLQPVPSATAIDRNPSLYAQNEPRPPVARQSSQEHGPEQVYLFRGFLNIFSLGMDDLAAKLEADGISATVTNHADADLITSRIVTSFNGGVRGPIVLVGHSLGADAIVEVADALAQYSIPVALLVLFDGTEPHQIPENVAAAINYTKHFMIEPAIGSRVAVSNVDLSGDASIDHLSIDRVPSLQAQTLNLILQAASAVPRKPVSRWQ